MEEKRGIKRRRKKAKKKKKLNRRGKISSDIDNE
jgi:hypothetical protein